MPKISFTEFRNELSRVLGTRQKAAAKASVKAVSATTETESESEAVASKPHSKHIKKDGKISAQASQIKELRSKLDEAIAENSQMREYFSPTSLQTAFTNALQAAGKPKSTTNTDPAHNPFRAKEDHPSYRLESMVPPTLKKPATIARIWGIGLGIAVGSKPERHS